MTDRDPLRLTTHVARSGYEDNDWFGYRINEDLLGQETMSSMAGLAVAGIRLSKDDLAILDDLAVAVTVADPRIWPLKITRLAGSYGSMFAAYSAGNLCLDEAVLSMKYCCVTAARLQALEPEARGLDDEALGALLDERWPERRPPGFGVPARPVDERVVGLRAQMARRGRTERKYYALFERVAAVIKARRGLESNLLLIFGAISLDLGFPPEKAGALAWVTAQNCFIANAVEGSEQAPEILRRLPAEALDYVGPPPRVSLRRQAAEAAEAAVKAAEPLAPSPRPPAFR